MFKRQRPIEQPRPEHPTPHQAFAALSEGRCMYAAIGGCTGAAAPMGLHHDHDDTDVLVCARHYRRLRLMDPRRVDELERFLRQAFRKPRLQDEDETIVQVLRR